LRHYRRLSVAIKPGGKGPQRRGVIVEGVQAQTRVLMRTVQRLKIPTLIFVNKIDRSGGAG
jgi:hypothetical protein